jgi:hypothetical protein
VFLGTNMRIPHALFIFCVVGVLAVAGPGLALAADGKQPDALTDKAATLYDEGLVAYKRSKWAEARASFLAAWALKQHWQIAGSLGDCELRLGLHREAAEHMAFFLRSAPLDRRTEDAKSLYERARGSLGTLTIDVDVKGADVIVDGKMVSTSPLEGPIFVEPGHHTLEARSADGRATEELDVLQGVARTIKLSVKKSLPLPSSSPPLPPPHLPPAPRSIVPGVVLAGIGGAALATGLGFIVAANGNYSDSRGLSGAIHDATHSCVPGAANFDSRCEDLHSTASAANTESRVGVGLMIGGGAAAVAAVTYFLWPKSTNTTSAGTPRLTPLISTSGAGLGWAGTF